MNDVVQFFNSVRHRVRKRQFSKVLSQTVARSSSAANFSLDPVELLMNGYTAASETDVSALARHLKGESELNRRILLEGVMASMATQDLVLPSEESKTNNLLAELTVPPPVIYQSMALVFGATELQPAMANKFSQSFFGWMFFDCYGFYKGYFEWTDTLDKGLIPENITGLSQYAFDCGVGRAIYVISGANPQLVVELVNRFAPSRRGALWSGIGLYLAFLGASDHNDIKTLRKLAGSYGSYLKEGVAQGIFILNDAETQQAHTKGVCEVICRAQPEEVLRIAAAHLNPDPHYVMDSTKFLDWKTNMASFFALN